MTKELIKPSLIRLNNIKKSFITSAGAFDALKGINLSIDKSSGVLEQ